MTRGTQIMMVLQQFQQTCKHSNWHDSIHSWLHCSLQAEENDRHMDIIQHVYIYIAYPENVPSISFSLTFASFLIQQTCLTAEEQSVNVTANPSLHFSHCVCLSFFSVMLAVATTFAPFASPTVLSGFYLSLYICFVFLLFSHQAPLVVS